jgi:hypothetical protein
MKPSRQIFAGSAIGAAAALVDAVFVQSHIATFVSWSLGVTLLLIGLIGGQRLPCFARALVSLLVLYWGYGTCLVGRTIQPGLTLATLCSALQCFSFLGVWPGLVMLRLWPLRQGAVLLAALFPLSFLLAALAAGTEECLFVRKYRDTGVGPTARWTVPMHWLAYDREQQRLDGSD